MKLMIRTGIISLFFVIFAVIAYGQDSPGVDEHNLVTQLLSVGSGSPAQADNYFANKKYTIVTRSTKDLGGYNAVFIKYKRADSTDSYTVMTVKDKIINAFYITYAKGLYLNAVDAALKMDFKLTEAVHPDPAQTVYGRGDERFIVRIGTANGKTFYVLAASNVLLAGKVIQAAKAN